MDTSSSATGLPSPTNVTCSPLNEQFIVPSSTRGSGAFRKDRRRMQNRIAQRAYRQRKESAIDVLSDKVLQLEKSKEEISQEFINFTTAILSQEAAKNCPEVLEYIRQSSFSLLRTAAGINDDEQPQDADTQPVLRPSEPQAGILPRLTPAVEQVNQPDLSRTTYTAEHDDATLVGSDAVPTAWSDWAPPSQGADSYFQLPVNQMESPLINFQLPGASYASSLPCPRTYSAQERTFGRRLQRATQEAGFLLASMKNPPPLLYKKVFGFCIYFETKEEIRVRMLDVLRRPENETLNGSRYPFINFFGPDIERARDLRLNPQLRILAPEYEGDFFDPDEIETCLRSYGVTIPPHKEFVTAHLDLTMFENTENPSPTEHHYHDSDIAMNSLHPEMNPGLYWGHQGIMGMATERTPALSESLPPREHWQTPLISKTKVTVDVERLITCLTNSTVCLGRTPGVRVPDIRKALKESLVYGV